MNLIQVIVLILIISSNFAMFYPRVKKIIIGEAQSENLKARVDLLYYFWSVSLTIQIISLFITMELFLLVTMMFHIFYTFVLFRYITPRVSGRFFLNLLFTFPIIFIFISYTAFLEIQYR